MTCTGLLHQHIILAHMGMRLKLSIFQKDDRAISVHRPCEAIILGESPMKVQGTHTFKAPKQVVWEALMDPAILAMALL